jgi:prepilin-type N-terminal cleavage/methylation domain-containing protein
MDKFAFSLIEVLLVVILIGILSALGYSSLYELIHANKAKEVAREMTAFAERALADSHTRKKPVTISIVNGNTIQAEMQDETPLAKTLASGFYAKSVSPLPQGCGGDFGNGSGATSQIRVGSSGISGSGCFTVCNAMDYCGSAVKSITKNTFTAYLKRKKSNSWEEL